MVDEAMLYFGDESWTEIIIWGITAYLLSVLLINCI